MANSKVIYYGKTLIDLTSDTVDKSSLLSGRTAHDKTGSAITGTMTNRGAVTSSLNTSTTSYTVPAGYHNGSGKVSITLEEKSATPSTSSQTVTPSSGKVLSKVTVDAIPSNYIIPSGTKTITTNGTHDVKAYASATVNIPPSGIKVYKHTITLTAVKVSRENSSSTTGTIISTFVLYSTTLNSSIAGEYNASNWDNLLNSLRSCFNAVDGRVYTIDNNNYTYKAISVQSSYNGSASYYTIGTDNGQLYFTNATTPPKEGASNQIGVYILWTGAYITGNGYTTMHSWYVLKNFNGGNVIVTDVVTEL